MSRYNHEDEGEAKRVPAVLAVGIKNMLRRSFDRIDKYVGLVQGLVFCLVACGDVSSDSRLFHGMLRTRSDAGARCSGVLVRLPEDTPSDPALVLTNGHCIAEQRNEEGPEYLEPNEIMVDEELSRGLIISLALPASTETNNSNEYVFIESRATQVIFASMTQTDISLFELDTSFEDIHRKYGVQLRTVSNERLDKSRSYFKKVSRKYLKTRCTFSPGLSWDCVCGSGDLTRPHRIVICRLLTLYPSCHRRLA